MQTQRITECCAACGKQFERWPSQTAKGTARFCGLACFYSWSRQRLDLVCPQCGRPFTAKVAHVARYGRRFCSRGCLTASRRERPYADRFWSQVDKPGPLPDACPELGPCWLWTGLFKQTKARASTYGAFRRAGKRELAHRVAWELTHGPIPDGQCCLHSCDVKACVNPDHLHLGTHQQNVSEAVARGRFPTGDASSARRHRELYQGERASHVTLTTAKVIEMRQLHADGWTHQALADRFGVAVPTVKGIVNRHRWAHV